MHANVTPAGREYIQAVRRIGGCAMPGGIRLAAEYANFAEKHGRFPIQQYVGRYMMHEREVSVAGAIVLGFAVGCQHHSFPYWSRHFARIAKMYRATRFECETARALINLARVRAGLKPMRSPRS